AGHPGVAVVELGEPPARRVAGPVTASLRVCADGSDEADWVCTLCVRDSDGALLNLCEGIARAASGADRVSVDLGSVCVELAPGQELVLLVAGASYPRWEPLPEARAQQILAGSDLSVHVL